MAPPKIDREKEEPFYWVQIVDSELGSIRFGPFTVDDFPIGVENEPQEMADHIQEDIKDHGLITALTNLGIYGGFEVRLIGDDNTRIGVWEVESP